MPKDVTPSVFSANASEILRRHGEVESYTVADSGIVLCARSRLRREPTTVFLDFDDGGQITGRFSFAQTQDDIAGLPQLLGGEIAECIRRFRAG